MLNENHLVKKSTPLIYAEWASLGAEELKIIEVYLSRIDIRNGNTCVRFTRNEFADLMGYKEGRNLKTKTFDDRLAKFLTQQIRIDLEDGTGYHRFNLFSDAKCYYDPDEGQTVIDIDCNNKLAPVFLELADGKNNGYKYISYTLAQTKDMKSEYSIKLYGLLLRHAWGSFKWVIDVKDLRKLLGATDKSYESFKYFNHHVLKKAQNEINELTDITFEYDRIVKARITRGVAFYIKRKKKTKPIEVSSTDISQIEDQTTWADDAPVIDTSGEIYVFPVEKNDEENYKLYAETLAGYNFTEKQIKDLGKVAEKMVPAGTSFDCFPLEIYAADILKEKLEVLEENKAKSYVEDEFKLLYAAVKNDWKPNHPMNKPQMEWDDLFKVPIFDTEKK